MISEKAEGHWHDTHREHRISGISYPFQQRECLPGGIIPLSVSEWLCLPGVALNAKKYEAGDLPTIFFCAASRSNGIMANRKQFPHRIKRPVHFIGFRCFTFGSSVPDFSMSITVLAFILLGNCYIAVQARVLCVKASIYFSLA